MTNPFRAFWQLLDWNDNSFQFVREKNRPCLEFRTSLAVSAVTLRTDARLIFQQKNIINNDSVFVSRLFSVVSIQ